MSTFRLGDIGTTIRVTIQEGGSAVDVSGATTKQIYLRKPNTGDTYTKTAIFTTDGTNGQIE
jgi:hypothetical protein